MTDHTDTPVRPDLCDAYAQAALRAWRSARLADALGQGDDAALLREQAQSRARTAAYCREKRRGWAIQPA